jgi:hypothetical protein
VAKEVKAAAAVAVKVAKEVKAVAVAAVKAAKEVKTTKEVVATKTKAAAKASSSNRRRGKRCRFQSPLGPQTTRSSPSCSQKPKKQGWKW